MCPCFAPPILGWGSGCGSGPPNHPIFKNDDGEGLIALGQIGGFANHAESPDYTYSMASSGVLGEGGSIALGPNSGVGTNPAYIDLTDLFGQLNITELTDQVINEARLEIGGMASQATSQNGHVSSEYVVGDLNLKFGSPILGDLTAFVPELAGSILEPVEDLLDELLVDLLCPLLDTITDALSQFSFNIPFVGTVGVTADDIDLEILVWATSPVRCSGTSWVSSRAATERSWWICPMGGSTRTWRHCSVTSMVRLPTRS